MTVLAHGYSDMATFKIKYAIILYVYIRFKTPIYRKVFFFLFLNPTMAVKQCFFVDRVKKVVRKK